MITFKRCRSLHEITWFIHNDKPALFHDLTVEITTNYRRETANKLIQIFVLMIKTKQYCMCLANIVMAV